MARPSIVPAIFGIALAIFGMLGAYGGIYPLLSTTYCAHALARMDQPAPDVLILGNSRTGRSVDPIYVQSLLRSEYDREISVERLAITDPDIPSFLLLSREFARSRGLPKLVIIQLMYERDPDAQAQIGTPVHSGRNVAIGNYSDLRAIQEQIETLDSYPGVQQDFHRGYRPISAVGFDKIINDIYAGFRFPQWAAKGVERENICPDDEPWRQSLIWPYADLPNAPEVIDPRDHGGPEDWRAEVAANLPLDPAADYRRFETDMMKALIDFYRLKGVEAVVTLYPTFGENLTQDTAKQIANAFPDLEFVDIITPFRSQTATDEARFFVDADHVSPQGATIVSAQMANLIAEHMK